MSAAPQNQIVHVVDNDVIFRFLDPFSHASARYMRLLEEIHSDDRQQINNHLANLLAATAYLTTHEIFRGQYAQSLLLSPAYRPVLISQVTHLAKTDISGKLKSLDPEYLATFIKKVRKALESTGPIADSQFIELRRRAPEIALSVMFQDDDPIAKLASIIENLATSNQEYLHNIDRRTSDALFWTENLEKALFNKRKYLIDKGFRTDDNLRDNISSDVQALVECILLNRQHGDKGLRFVFLTGDSGIHHLIDGLYRNRPPVGWPQFNFVRRPVQLSEFMKSESDEEAVVSQYLSFVFGSALAFSEDRENHLFNLMYHWFDRPEGSEEQRFKGLESSSDRFASAASREIEKAIVKARESSLLLYGRQLFNSAKANIKDKKYIEDVATVLEDSEVMNFLASGVKHFKESISKLSPYILDEEKQTTDSVVEAVEWLLEAFGSKQNGNNFPHHRRRLPYFPDFSSHIAETLNSITSGDDAVSYPLFLSKLTELDWMEVQQINIFIAGLLGEWGEAAALAELSLDVAQKSNPKARAELCYLKAVALRHISGATTENLREAQIALDQALKISPQESRYLLERSALGLAWIYHNHFYNWQVDNSEFGHASRIWDDLLLVEQGISSISSANNHVLLRLQSQLAANKLIYVMFGHAFGLLDDTRLKNDGDRTRMIEGATSDLVETIDKRGGASRVSYYLEFLKYSGELMIALERKDKYQVVEKIEAIDKLISSEAYIIDYDRRKMDDFLRWARRIYS